VLPAGPRRADVGISDGVFAEIADELPGGREEIDASGLHVLPGGISHHPDESVSEEDVAAAIEAARAFVRRLCTTS
jgi:dihydroorotase-like cyclic amidohydrolase